MHFFLIILNEVKIYDEKQNIKEVFGLWNAQSIVNNLDNIFAQIQRNILLRNGQQRRRHRRHYTLIIILARSPYFAQDSILAGNFNEAHFETGGTYARSQNETKVDVLVIEIGIHFKTLHTC